jgi:hypothetical protein
MAAKNLKITPNGTKLIIEVDLTKVVGPSKSGKNTIIATTGGNMSIDTPKGEVTIGVNVYK